MFTASTGLRGGLASSKLCVLTLCYSISKSVSSVKFLMKSIHEVISGFEFMVNNFIAALPKAPAFDPWWHHFSAFCTTQVVTCNSMIVFICLGLLLSTGRARIGLCNINSNMSIRIEDMVISHCYPQPAFMLLQLEWWCQRQLGSNTVCWDRHIGMRILVEIWSSCGHACYRLES